MDGFKQKLRGIEVALLALLTVIALCWALGINGLAMQRFFMPAQEQNRRVTFEQSKAYRQGMIQELENMRFEYIMADPAHKAALASIIRHRAADFPADAMPVELITFTKELP